MPAAASTSVTSRVAVRTISSGVVRCSAGGVAKKRAQRRLDPRARCLTGSDRLGVDDARGVVGIEPAPRVGDEGDPCRDPTRAACGPPPR